MHETWKSGDWEFSIWWGSLKPTARLKQKCTELLDATVRVRECTQKEGIEKKIPWSSLFFNWKHNGGRQQVQDRKCGLSCSSTSLWHNLPLPHLITSESVPVDISHKALWISFRLLVISYYYPKVTSPVSTLQFTWQSFLTDKPCYCGTSGRGYKL